MSVTISNCNEICHSPSNSSKSKMLYTFSKSTRFPSRRRILCDNFYDVPSSTTSPQRTTTFGYGNKYDFTKQSSCAPPSNTYNLKDDFKENIKKGFGFGQGRNEMVVTGPLMETIRNKNPGPGTYEKDSNLLANKLAYTFNGKMYKEDREKMKIPGPGKYPVTFCISETGNYFLSKYKNSGVKNFSKLDNRCKTTENRVPGPGHYDTSKADLSPTGRYVTSKIHNCLNRRFEGFSGRGEIADRKNTPGPGNYKLPSDFGHYVSKKTNIQKRFHKSSSSSSDIASDMSPQLAPIQAKKEKMVNNLTEEKKDVVAETEIQKNSEEPMAASV